MIGSRRLLLAVLLVSTPAILATGRPTDDGVEIVLKFVKHGSPSAPVARFDPASCAACTPVTTPLFSADNPRETVVALRIPRE